MEQGSKRTAPPLRILMVAARSFPFMGGIESHIHEVGRRMVLRGHKVCVLTADTSGTLPSSEQVEGMHIIRVPAWLAGTDFCLAPGLATRLGDEHWDVAHIQGYHTFSAPLGMMAAIVRKVPFVMTFHSGGHSSGLRNSIRTIQCAALRPLAKRAARLLAVSRFEAESFSRRMRIPRDRFTIVPNGASLPAPTGVATRKPDAPLIVSLGRLERYKGHHRVIKAFSALLQEYPQARLRVLGEGPYKTELLRIVTDFGLQDSVTVGAIPPKDRRSMANLLASASLVTLLSEYEAHPVAVMEALSLGVPVLTSNTSGFIELAEKGLVQAIAIDSSDQEVTAAISLGLRQVRTAASISLPDWDDCTDQLLSIYSSVRDDAALGIEDAPPTASMFSRHAPE